MFLLPFASAGEQTLPLTGRCYRLLLWSSTMMIPLGIGWLLEPLVLRWSGELNQPAPQNWLGGSLFLVWWFVVLLRSMGYYAGPAEGRAWRAREPECERCGYNIGMLPVMTNCPECGRPVFESLPGHRIPTAFASANGARASFLAFFTTLRAAMWDRTSFDRLSVQRDPRRDRLFCLLVTALSASMLGAAVGISGAALYEPFGVFAFQVAVEVACIGFVIEVLLVGGLAAIIVGPNRRAMHSATTLMCYVASLSVQIGMAALLVSTGFVGLACFSAEFPRPAHWEEASSCMVRGIGTGLFLLAISGIIGLRDLRRAMRQTRRANG